MTFTISLPTTLFFPDVAPPAGACLPQRGLQRLPLPARAACACVAALVSSALIGSVVWGISVAGEEPAGAVIAIAAAQPSGSR